MKFRFQDGDEVVLKNGEDHAWFLPTGSRGVVFCQYSTTPPAYEVNFCDIRGETFGAVVYEDELDMVNETVASKTLTIAGAV